MLITSFASNPVKMQEMRDRFKAMSDYDESNPYLIWESKIGMLKFELEEFLRICSDLDELAKTQDKHLAKAAQMQKENDTYRVLINSNMTDPKNPKREESIINNTNIKKRAEELAELFGKLKNFVAAKIVEVDIPYIKERKKKRLADIVDSYSKKCIEYHAECGDFWKQTQEFFSQGNHADDRSLSLDPSGNIEP